MSRNEIARRLRRALKSHAEEINPSSQALFAINRRIKDAENPAHGGVIKQRLLRPVAVSFKPAFAIGAAFVLLAGILGGIWLVSGDGGNGNPATQIAVAGPASGNSSSENAEQQVALPVLDDSCPSNAVGENVQGYVDVYFLCGNNLVARSRSSSSLGLEEAVRLLAAGPTQSEIQRGITSDLVDVDETLIKSIELENGRAVIDFSSALPSSPNVLRQLNATAFNFPNVHLVEYRVEGSCDAFSETADNGSCNTYYRNGPRPGGGESFVVPIYQAGIAFRTIYACPNADTCRSLGGMTSDQIYRFTGAIRTISDESWLELLTPTGQLGWISGHGVSVQRAEPADQENLYRIVLSLSTVSGDQSDLLKNSFSSDGLYGSFVRNQASYLRFHTFEFSDPGIIENIDRILERLQNVEIANEPTPPFPILDNLEYMTVAAEDHSVNVYFDFRHGTPQVIAISVHI